jgi:type IV pilus assembly protein PilN
MPRINLLPWREDERKERKLAFTVALGASALGAAVVTFAIYLMYGTMIDAQEHRNDLETSKQRFVARMDIIEKLQRSRPEIVHVFDEIVRTLPDGVYLTGVKQTDKKFKFEGVAQSSTRVSSFMRNIDGSEWLRNPELEVVQTAKDKGPGSNFTLYAQQVSTVSEDEGSGKGKGKPGAKVMASRGAR